MRAGRRDFLAGLGKTGAGPLKKFREWLQKEIGRAAPSPKRISEVLDAAAKHRFLD